MWLLDKIIFKVCELVFFWLSDFLVVNIFVLLFNEKLGLKEDINCNCSGLFGEIDENCIFLIIVFFGEFFVIVKL